MPSFTTNSSSSASLAVDADVEEKPSGIVVYDDPAGGMIGAVPAAKGKGDRMSAIELLGTEEADQKMSENEVQDAGRATETVRGPVRKVWIDLENSPHIPFFLPIIKELEKRNCKVILTARDCFQVCEMADMAGMKYRKIGHHYGKHIIAKIMGLGFRVLQITPVVLRERPAISVSHGSRTSVFVSSMLGIRSVCIFDYEHTENRTTDWIGSGQKRWIMTPEVIPIDILEKFGTPRDHILQYPGIKEDVYVPFFQPDSSLKAVLGIQPNDVVVTLRPPASEAHYHNPESEKLLMAVFDQLAEHPEVKTILLPRTHKQGEDLRAARTAQFDSGRIVVPEHAVNGLDLIWHSDVVISGGGTMNREAAALGVPVYSLFRGTMGAVDRHLAETGKLVMLQSEQDVRAKLQLVRRSKTPVPLSRQRASLDAVVNHITAILDLQG
jgi:predicted glycosyltransferase